MCCKDNCITKIIHKRVPYILIIVRFLLEGCIDIGMSAIICILMLSNQNFEHLWEAVSTVFAFLFLLLLFLTPFLLFWMIKRYLRKVKESGDRKASTFN